MIDYFLYIDARLRWITNTIHWIAAPTHLPLCYASSGNDDLCPIYLQVS
jgi:hypothetical protein